MKYKTLNNMEKATQMIADKGYDWETANNMAINAFEQVQANNFYHHVEFYIDKILYKKDYDILYKKDCDNEYSLI